MKTEDFDETDLEESCKPMVSQEATYENAIIIFSCLILTCEGDFFLSRSQTFWGVKKNFYIFALILYKRQTYLFFLRLGFKEPVMVLSRASIQNLT